MTLYQRVALIAFGAFVITMAGCGGEAKPHLVQHIPLDDLTELMSGDSGATIDHEVTHDGGGAFHVYSRGMQKIAVVEVLLNELQNDHLTVTLMAKNEALERPFTLEVALIGVDGDGRFLTYPVSGQHRTLDWYPVSASFAFKENETPVKARISLMIPAGVLWIDELKIWDGDGPEAAE
jgi:hypothetical protein